MVQVTSALMSFRKTCRYVTLSCSEGDCIDDQAADQPDPLYKDTSSRVTGYEMTEANTCKQVYRSDHVHPDWISDIGLIPNLWSTATLRLRLCWLDYRQQLSDCCSNCFQRGILISEFILCVWKPPLNGSQVQKELMSLIIPQTRLDFDST